MDHTPPPFFNRGPAPLVRLAFFASLSLALLVLDARFHYAEGLRSIVALAVYPLQALATLPAALGERMREEIHALSMKTVTPEELTSGG